MFASAHDTTAPQAPSLSVVITAVPLVNNDNPTYWVGAGDRITYTITLRNTGDAMSSSLFTSTIPSNTSYVTSTSATLSASECER